MKGRLYSCLLIATICPPEVGCLIDIWKPSIWPIILCCWILRNWNWKCGSYSVAYFDRIAVFEAPYRWTSGSYALRSCMNIEWIYEVHMSPAFNRSSAIQRFKGSDAIEIRNGITFGFCTGLPQMIYVMYLVLDRLSCWLSCNTSSLASKTVSMVFRRASAT